MKVLVHTPDLTRKGGVATFCATLKNHLKCNADFLVTGMKRESRSIVLMVFRILIDYINYLFVLSVNQYDLVHVNPSLKMRALFRDAGFILIAKCFRKKVLVFIHGWDMECEQKLRQRWLWLFSRTYFLADAFVVLADDFRKRLCSMGYQGPIYLGKTSFDNSILSCLEENETFVSSQRVVFNILLLSRIEKEKGIMEALESYAILKLQHPNISMTIAGDGNALEEAKKFAAELKLEDIKFLGHIGEKDKIKVFQASHCYLFPSYHEGMPISVLEAMAFGLPVITRPVGALEDFFEDGFMGYWSNDKSPETFAILIKKLIDNPETRDKMSRYNHRYAMANFTPSSATAYLESVYTEICQG